VLTPVREDCWRCANTLVEIDDLVGPLNGVAHADPGGLGSSPQFQILWSVVITDAIAMVHCFTVQQVPSKKLLCDENVFEHVRMPPCSRALRNSYDYVPSLVARAASPPVAVGLPRFTPTVATCQ
jgi:hypothetical protein